MSDSSDDNKEALFQASLELLECRKLRSRFIHCIACGEEMSSTPLRICTECLDDRCDAFCHNAIDK